MRKSTPCWERMNTFLSIYCFRFYKYIYISIVIYIYTCFLFFRDVFLLESLAFLVLSSRLLGIVHSPVNCCVRPVSVGVHRESLQVRDVLVVFGWFCGASVSVFGLLVWVASSSDLEP